MSCLVSRGPTRRRRARSTASRLVARLYLRMASATSSSSRSMFVRAIHLLYTTHVHQGATPVSSADTKGGFVVAEVGVLGVAEEDVGAVEADLDAVRVVATERGLAPAGGHVNSLASLLIMASDAFWSSALVTVVACANAYSRTIW